ncbi:MAG: hypothetical protein Q7U39_18155 [Nitrospira sp.]|nr:hypothetical protein [Nitrospira sp.]
MNMTTATCACLLLGLTSAGCETEQLLLKKSALTTELRKETTRGVSLPAGCPTLIKSLPATQTSLTVSYIEPTKSQNGVLLTDLAYTTIYLNAKGVPTTAIRVWTNDPHGGAQVTISDIPVTASEIGLCVTATNWAGKESLSASTTP